MAGLEFKPAPEDGADPAFAPLKAPARPLTNAEEVSAMAARLAEADARARAEAQADDLLARSQRGVDRLFAGKQAGPDDDAAKRRPDPALVTLARFLWAGEYLASGLSARDWWDGLDAGRKRYAEGALSAILHP